MSQQLGKPSSEASFAKSEYSFHSYSSLAQSVEHMTVNHGVVGSSPTGGAKKKSIASATLFFLLLLFVFYANTPSPRLRGLWAMAPAPSVSSLASVCR